jgi:hypothetical protein
VPEALANDTLDTISVHCFSAMFFCNSQTQPSMITLIRYSQYEKVAIPGAPTLTKNPTKFVGLK